MTPGSTGLPGGETRRGQQHAREAGDEPKAFRASPRETRVIWRELDCSNPKPQWCNGTPPATTLDRGATGSGCVALSHPRPSGRWATANDAVQGAEWGAYLTLGRSARRNVGSPTGREPYGDGVPVVATRGHRPRATKGDRWSDNRAARY